MIQASSPLTALLRGQRVEPAFERRLRVLVEHCRRSLPRVDEDRLRRAFQVAYWAHRDDHRASGERYISHPLEVALIAARDIRFDDTTVVAALLHDTVEDTDLSLDLIAAEFGPVVAAITDGVTKIDHVFGNRQLGRDENVRKLMLSMASDIRVILVKFADRLHNMRTLGSLPHEKQLAVATETLDLFAPLAHRFGLHSVKTELEDLSLKALEPEAYQAIAGDLNAKRRQRERFVERFIAPVRAELAAAGLDFEIVGRPKSIFSIWRKMRQQHLADLDGIYDLFAIRIILKSTGKQGREDCWRVYSMLTSQYKPLDGRYRDFISHPKSNGYQSLHNTVIGPDGQRVEIQIRTEEMHEIAERGVAAHWKYKERPSDAAKGAALKAVSRAAKAKLPEGKAKLPEGKASKPAAQGDGLPVAGKPTREEHIDTLVGWVRDVLENPAPERASDFVRDFRLNLYDEEIYVFTPKGDLFTLPRGATPVDFAFHVHSQVGFHCIGAKVNGRLVPLSHRLASGDQVEVLTSKKQTPNPDWIKFVVTHRARARIRHWANEEKLQTVERGRALLEKKLKRAKITLDDQDLHRVTSKLKFATSQQLLFEIGAGLFDADEFVAALRKAPEPEPAPPAGAPVQITVERFAHDAREQGRPALFVDGERHDALAVQYAACCTPIPGDEVFGYVSKAGAVKVHRASCPNAAHLLLDHAERILPVEWSRQKDVQFVAGLRLVGEDRVGMVSDVTTVISKSLKTNIRSITIDSTDGFFEGTIVLYVSDLKHLQRLIGRLGRVDGISGVYRLENARAEPDAPGGTRA